MRKMVITLLALGVFAASAALAGNLINEPFTYANGNLVPNDGWVTFNGTGDIQVASNLVIGQMGLSASGADDTTPFTLRPTNAPTYACFRVMIPCAEMTSPPMPAYFAGFNTTANTTLMMSRTYLLPLTGGGWTFGISNTSTSTAYGVTPWTATLACDTWYTIVIKYDPSLGTSTLWVNPVDESSPSVSNTRSDLAAVAINTFFLRQGSVTSGLGYTGSGAWKWNVDNVGVGTSFIEACYTEPVPVNGSTWGQLKSLYR